MSWKNIIQTAKKFQTPVIITDDNGHDPLVVLSLEKYDELLSNQNNSSKNTHYQERDTFESIITQEKVSAPDKLTEEAFESLPTVDNNQPVNKPISTDSNIETYQKINNSLNKKQKETSVNNLSTEERFYFEPIEDNNLNQ